MDVFGQKYDLLHMKEYFENQIPDIRLLSDMKLSEKDFKKLGTQLKAAFTFTDGKAKIEDFALCYLVYWVYALIYWDEQTGIHDELTEYCSQLPQYQIRHHLQLMVDTFADYGLYEFNYKSDSVEELCSILIARHAGVPDAEKYRVFELIDDYRNLSVSVDAMVADIYARLPYRSQYIFSLLDKESRQDIIWEIRTIMAETCSKARTRDELLEKYPRISVNLIDCCSYWEDRKVLLQNAR